MTCIDVTIFTALKSSISLEIFLACLDMSTVNVVPLYLKISGHWTFPTKSMSGCEEELDEWFVVLPKRQIYRLKNMSFCVFAPFFH